MIKTQPDYPGRSREALECLFDGLVADIQEQWRKSTPKATSPDLPEPMLGEMGRLT